MFVAVAGLVTAGCGGATNRAAESTTTGSTVDFDRAFIDAMVPHHQAAIAMAKAAKKAGLSQPELIDIADNIVLAQQDEIDQMRAWRLRWFNSSAVDPDGGSALGLTQEAMGMQHSPNFSMAEDVNAAFAAMMVEHHRGAVTMAKLALDRAQHSEIKDLADSIIDAQEREIAVMEPHAEGMHHGG